MNHLRRTFDNETGREFDQSILNEELLYETQILEQGNALEALRPLPGWKIVEEFCNLKVEAAKEKLLTEKDHEEILRLQSQAAAFISLLNSMDSVIREAQEIRQIQREREATQVAEHNSHAE